MIYADDSGAHEQNQMAMYACTKYYVANAILERQSATSLKK